MEKVGGPPMDSMERSTLNGRWSNKQPSVAEMRLALVEKNEIYNELVKGQKIEQKLKKDVKNLASDLSKAQSELVSSKNDAGGLKVQIEDIKTKNRRHDEILQEIEKVREEIRGQEKEIENLNSGLAVSKQGILINRDEVREERNELLTAQEYASSRHQEDEFRELEHRRKLYAQNEKTDAIMDGNSSLPMQQRTTPIQSPTALPALPYTPQNYATTQRNRGGPGSPYVARNSNMIIPGEYQLPNGDMTQASLGFNSLLLHSQSVMGYSGRRIEGEGAPPLGLQSSPNQTHAQRRGRQT